MATENMPAKQESESNMLDILLDYLLLLISLIIIISFIFKNFGRFQTDVESARSLLSTLIQSEATIFAIVISLSLVAVQLSASSYSTKLVNIFIEDPHFQIIVSIYILIITYGLIVLKLIKPSQENFSNLEFEVSSCFCLGVFAFLALIPYTKRTLNLLKPSTIIDQLVGEIKKERILPLYDTLELKEKENDPLLQINDILAISLKNEDYSTILYGIQSIRKRLELILKTYTASSLNDLIFVEHMLYFFLEWKDRALR
jgi:hypothetical protein